METQTGFQRLNVNRSTELVLKNVYLHQFNQCYDDSVFLPLSIGSLKAFALQNQNVRENYWFSDLIFQREPLPKIEQYYSPYVVCFSSYIWNERINYYVAEQLKSHYNCIVVFGGPSVPNKSEEYLRRHRFIDYLVHGEGEVTFVELLEAMHRKSELTTVKGISFLQDDMYIKTPEQFKVKNLDILPSPFLEGMFDDVVNASTKFSTVWETSRGCPYRCSFCYWGSNQQKISYTGTQRLKDELKWIADHKIEYVMFGDSNFGLTDRDVEVAKLIINSSKERGYPKSFILNFAKNSSDRVFNIAKMMYDAGLNKSVTLSFQSLNDTVLENINRKNIKLSTFQELQTKYRMARIPTYSELIVPLPGETLKSFIEGMELLLQSGQDQIVVLQLTIIPNSDVADKNYQNKFGLKTRLMPIRKFEGVQEYEEVVISTNTMSNDDCQTALVLSYLVFIYITMKCAYFIIFYLVKKFNIKITDFLLQLRTEINKHPDSYPVLYKEDQRLVKYVKDLYSPQNAVVDISDLPLSQDITWKLSEVTFLSYAIHRNAYMNELKLVVKKLFPDCEPDLLDELIEYQNNRLVNYKPAKLEQKYHWNFKDFFEDIITNLSPVLKNDSYVSVINDPNQYCSFDDFVLLQVRYGKKKKHFIYPEL